MHYPELPKVSTHTVERKVLMSTQKLIVEWQRMTKYFCLMINSSGAVGVVKKPYIDRVPYFS